MRFHLSLIRQGLAAAYVANGQDTEAEAQLKESIRLAEETRAQISDAQSRKSFLASQQSVYRAMISFQFLNKNDPAKAFNYAEIAKGRDLLDALTGARHVTVNDGQVRLNFSGGAAPLTLEQAQRSLPANVQFAQYVASEDKLMIWLVTRDGVVTRTAPIGADALRDKVETYLEDQFINVRFADVKTGQVCDYAPTEMTTKACLDVKIPENGYARLRFFNGTEDFIFHSGSDYEVRVTNLAEAITGDHVRYYYNIARSKPERMWYLASGEPAGLPVAGTSGKVDCLWILFGSAIWQWLTGTGAESSDEDES